MKREISMLFGMAIGAGLMYLLDPENGRRRQALMRDKFMGLANDAQEMAASKARHLGNQAYGMMAEARSMVSNQG
ncbi:MAG TPA: hypothetical protein VF590_08215 [Isosphaeraceae bacterium]|jgi:hypothetical protein